MDASFLVYAGLLLFAATYAMLLNTAAGKQFATDYTWASVVIGTLLVLAALYMLIPVESWWRVCLAFVVAGAPMIARSLFNKAHRS